MRIIKDKEGIAKELNVADLIEEFEDDIFYLHESYIDEYEWQLMETQYGYIKFGLLLEKICRQSLWNRCKEKFRDFKSFCHAKVNMNYWQAVNAIESAKVARNLAALGFTELPRNASQALKLAKLSIERLGEVWANILKTCAGHKITADAIEREINPDRQPTSSALRIPALLQDKIRREAIERGLTIAEYLEELITRESRSDERVEENECNFSDDQIAILDNLDQQFTPIARAIAPQKIIESTFDRFDTLMDTLIGQFIPPPMRTHEF